MLRRALIAALLLTLCITTGLWAYHRYLRPFRIAVVRFSDTDWAMWEKAVASTPYSLRRFDDDVWNSMALENYNLVVIRAMGLNLTDEQINRIESARSRGTQFLMLVPTNDLARQQNKFPEDQKAVIDSYLQHGGEDNLIGLLHYAARQFGGKDVDVPELIEKPQSGFFHIGDTLFDTLEDYESYLDKQRPDLPENAPRVALVGAFLDPHDTLNRTQIDHILKTLESKGARVYPIFGYRNSMELLKATKPYLVIAFPHGRMTMGNRAPDILKELDCPCISALALLGSEEEWMADERGMAGNFMSQSIVTPELDGIVEPIPVTSMEPNQRNIEVRTIIRDRIEKRINLALNWLKLQRKPNSEKRIVVVYYKAPGLAALSAGGLEVAPSLFNTLKRLETEGYDLGDQMPASPEELFELIQTKGKTLGQWAIGSYEEFLEQAEPEFVPAEDYARWFRQALSEKRQKETLDLWGPIPGKQMVAQRNEKPYLVISRVRLGNVVIMPQPTVGGGGEDEDEVASIHGTNQAVPHFYLGAYLWARHGFKADAIVHYGTHGSLEFTYGKSVCLSRDCWPDILIGDVPHIYPYVINNVGEAMIAKRRSNAILISHLTPPFTESSLYGELSTLHDKIHDWESAEDQQLREATRQTITELVGDLQLAADLDIAPEALQSRLLDDTELDSLHNYIHQLKDQSITDGLHVIGRSFSEEQVHDTVFHMLGAEASDTVMESIGILDAPDVRKVQAELLRDLVDRVLDGRVSEEDFFDEEVLTELRAANDSVEAVPAQVPEEATTQPQVAQQSTDASAVDPAGFWDEEGPSRVRNMANLTTARRFLAVLDDIRNFAMAIRQSPETELDHFVRALRGGYIPPSSGGDPIANPDSVPTGRNLYGVDAEKAPTEEAWRVGCRLADDILARQLATQGRYPQQVAFSLWGGEFIRGKGTNIAQILYLMGVRPVRNSRGSVYDVEVIPSEELGRPRVDVLVQTSGQFRDIAASRITLMDKAVQLVSDLEDEPHPNFVRDGTTETEMRLKQEGLSPREARDFATARIFGAANNRSYGTDIMGLVEKGDTWEDERQVADRYVENMGGIYRDGTTWGTYRKGLFEAQMQGTEVVIQPRSSNTWGPLSLDHVYEFMGGMTLAIRNKTGVDPTGYFNDLRKRGRARATTSVSAIREEARTTIWNPKFIQGMQREGASAAASLTESVRNMYGWNVMQPSAISQDMWDETYAVFIDDKHDLAMREYFEGKNPYALQNMTSVMLETARKGYWEPSDEVLQNLAKIHVELVRDFGAGCSYETCGNSKLQEFIEGNLIAPGSEVTPQMLADYQASLASVLESSTPLPDVEGIAMDEKIEQTEEADAPTQSEATLLLATCILGATVLLLGAGYIRPRHATAS